MELLDKPVVKPKIVAKITKINNLVIVSSQARKSSTSLRKVFEKGSYQKKTQLAVLKRYKKRLDSIQKQNDRAFTKKQRVKIKLPDIKKYAGSLFTSAATSDPLKAIAALAAFNTARKVANKDYLGAVGPGLVAAGILFGPKLVRGGLKSFITAKKSPISSTSPSASGSRLLFGTPYAETKAGKAYAGMRLQRNLPNWAQRAAGGSAKIGRAHV